MNKSFKARGSLAQGLAFMVSSGIEGNVPVLSKTMFVVRFTVLSPSKWLDKSKDVSDHYIFFRFIVV